MTNEKTLGESLRELDRSWTREMLRDMGPERAYQRAVERDNELTLVERVGAALVNAR